MISALEGRLYEEQLQAAGMQQVPAGSPRRRRGRRPAPCPLSRGRTRQASKSSLLSPGCWSTPRRIKSSEARLRAPRSTPPGPEVAASLDEEHGRAMRSSIRRMVVALDRSGSPTPSPELSEAGEVPQRRRQSGPQTTK